jgi:hypothetical protein
VWRSVAVNDTVAFAVSDAWRRVGVTSVSDAVLVNDIDTESERGSSLREALRVGVAISTFVGDIEKLSDSFQEDVLLGGDVGDTAALGVSVAASDLDSE